MVSSISWYCGDKCLDVFKGEISDKRLKTADLKSGARKQFGFFVPRDKKGKKLMHKETLQYPETVGGELIQTYCTICTYCNILIASPDCKSLSFY